jgi:hypothetical protein
MNSLLFLKLIFLRRPSTTKFGKTAASCNFGRSNVFFSYQIVGHDFASVWSNFHFVYCFSHCCDASLAPSQAVSLFMGRAVAQAVSLWFPTSATRAACRVCGGQSGTGAGFLRVLRFPLTIFIPSISPQSPSNIIRGWYNRPVVAAVPEDPSHKLKKKVTIFLNWNLCMYKIRF